MLFSIILKFYFGNHFFLISRKPSSDNSDTPGSARRVFGSIEKSFHKVVNVLTPRKSEDPSSGKPPLLTHKVSLLWSFAWTFLKCFCLKKKLLSKIDRWINTLRRFDIWLIHCFRNYVMCRLHNVTIPI